MTMALLSCSWASIHVPALQSPFIAMFSARALFGARAYSECPVFFRAYCFKNLLGSGMEQNTTLWVDRMSELRIDAALLQIITGSSQSSLLCALLPLSLSAMFSES
jgi:hypothetical protein